MLAHPVDEDPYAPAQMSVWRVKDADRDWLGRVRLAIPTASAIAAFVDGACDQSVHTTESSNQPRSFSCNQTLMSD